MTSLIRTQILAVRDTGETNMFAINAVQRIAYDYELYELVTYLEDKDNQKEYFNFILYGDGDSLIPDDEPDEVLVSAPDEDADVDVDTNDVNVDDTDDAANHGEQNG